MAVSGSMQFSSAFSQKMWKPSLENSNIIYEVSKDEEVEEVTEKEVARPKTKFNKLLNNNYQISPIKSAGKSTTSKVSMVVVSNECLKVDVHISNDAYMYNIVRRA